MALHRLSSVTIGVPEPIATRDYYTDFGLSPGPVAGWAPATAVISCGWCRPLPGAWSKSPSAQTLPTIWTPSPPGCARWICGCTGARNR